jgi:superfamily I DNA and/or RNA helicase
MEDAGLNVLLNLNENSYRENSYFTLLNQLRDLMENGNITIDDYFEAITNNYSNWGEAFYISNISIKEDKPYLLFRPKLLDYEKKNVLRRKLLELFPDNFTIGFKVAPKIDEKTKQYYPFFINEFVKLVESEKREWEIEARCNISPTKNKSNKNKDYVDNFFVQKLPLISSKTQEKTLYWYEYLEWKYHADLTTSTFYDVIDNSKSDKSFKFKLNKKLPNKIVKSINDYGVYLFSKTDVEIQSYEDNGKQKQRLIYTNKNKRLSGQRKIINGAKQYIFDNYIDDKFNNKIFKYENGYLSINIKNIKNYEEIAFIVLIEKDKRFTNTKLISNIDLFQEQGGYAPFLSSYLFDIKNARIPTESTQLDFYNKDLTDEQKKAVQIMYDSPDIALIQGPPGTGKTTVIAECIYQYVKQGKKVMLTSESNDAVDNALERLFDEPDVIPLRLTSSYRDDDSKFSKEDATKTYYKETLANPSDEYLKKSKKKDERKKEYSKIYENFQSYNEKLKKYTDSLNNIKNNIKKLKKEYTDLESKEQEIKVANQSNEKFTNLKEKIEKNNLNIKIIGDELSENIIEIFNNTVLVETENLTTNFFKTELTDTGKSTYLRTNYIHEGLDRFFKSQAVLSKAKLDLSYVKSLKSSEIVKKETLDKIEELEYKIRDAQEVGNKKAYDEFRKEKSKLEREKGLNIEEYVIDDMSFADRYFIQYEQNKYKIDLKQIIDTLSKFEEIKSLDNDILNIHESIKGTDKEILELEQNIESDTSLLHELNITLESLNNNIQNIENDKQTLEGNCQKQLTKINSFKLFDFQTLLDNLELSSSSISNTQKSLIDLQLTEKEIIQKLDDQRYLKKVDQDLGDLNKIVKDNDLLNRELESNKQDLENEINSKDQLLRQKTKNSSAIFESNTKINKYQDSNKFMNFFRSFSKEDEEKNIASLTKENQQLTIQVDSIDKKIDNLKDKIKTLESEIDSNRKQIASKVDSIKTIKLYEFNEIIKKLEINNIGHIHNEVRNNIWSNTEVEEFKSVQENLTPISEYIQKLEDEFKQLTLKLSEIEKLKKQKNSSEENYSKIHKNIKKLECNLDSKKLAKETSEKELEEIKTEYASLKKSCDRDNEEDLLLKQTETEKSVKELLNINTNDKIYEYLNDKIGQNSNKNEAIKLLEYFIEVFENESDTYNETLRVFLEKSDQYIVDNPVDIFDKTIKTKVNNQIIDQKNELQKVESNINSVKNQIKAIKLKLKKESTDNDTILNYLKEQIKENKIDDNEQIMRPLIENWVKNIEEHIPTQREDEIYFNNVNVAGITLNASEKMLKDINLEYFDVVIVDEISKSTPPEYLRGMMRAKKAILVGDHRQLPPLFSYHGQDFSFEDATHDEQNNEVLSLENFNKYKKLVTASQFQEFFTEADERIKYRLTKQFRMHTDIMELINCFYGGQLTQGISEDPREHNKEKMHDIYIPNFIEKKDHAVWVDTTSIFSTKIRNMQIQDSTTKKNPFEAFLTIEALKKLDEFLHQQYKERQEKLSIGIISFYLGQVRLLNKMVKECNLKYFDIKNKENIMISTVDSFQGRDRDIILVDLISTKRKVGKENFVSSFQRINVAFSRAKRLLVIFGSKDIFDDYEVDIPNIDDESIVNKEKVYGKIANIIRQNGCNKEATSVGDLNTWNIEKEKYGYTNEQN